MGDLYIGLVHYPIYNKHGEVIATAITNYDVHDIARAAITYDVSRYFIIHPNEKQRELVDTVTDHWKRGLGSTYNPDRKEAFSLMETIPSLEEAIAFIERERGEKPFIVTTDARTYENTISYSSLRKEIEEGQRPCLLLFGTGYGMTKKMMEQFDYILEPIYGHGPYNHLSVRSAVSIILDRLRGTLWWDK